ncbi:hypothetical protein [Microbacterium sp. MYb66]|jgi:hypothetical protein|uniref:hypothetical protein n=1 Tax=Microbacterium sp. MYb66 TaxID=1848692 RepID=UPI000CFF3BA7|nr:hypothetical protein [Microbacterium sp. MYb66]PRA81122.1 hypothetical protein CQ045_07730 [Microbacterium sp. MYb66]
MRSVTLVVRASRVTPGAKGRYSGYSDATTSGKVVGTGEELHAGATDALRRVSTGHPPFCAGVERR